MTAPALPGAPQIGSTGLHQQPGIAEAVAPLLHALSERRKLDLARQELQQKQQQFEIQQKMFGKQMEGMDLANELKKRELAASEKDLVARDQAIQLYTGNLPQLNNPKGVGEVIARIKDPAVAAHFYALLKEGIGITTSLTPKYDFREAGTPTGGTEIVGFNPQDPTHPVGTGRPGPPPAASLRIPVVTEREKASAAVSSIRANATINRFDATDPTIGARVAQKAALQKSLISGIMRRVAGTSQEDASLLAESQVEQNMTPQELEYYVAGKQLLSGILPGLSGKQVTAREYVMHAPAYLSMGSTNPNVIAGRAKARNTRIRSFIKEAGDAFAERIPELQDVNLSAYGLGTARPATANKYSENPY